MTRIRKCLITLIVLLTVLFSQSRMVNQKPLTEQIHENIQKALLMNQFSEGARPIDEIQQHWRNDQWENYVRYTYEYNPAKRRDTDPYQELGKMTFLLFNNSAWVEVRRTTYTYDDEDNLKTYTTYDSDSGDPRWRTDHAGPFHNGIATTETYSTSDGSSWKKQGLIQRIFEDGYPTVITESVWNENSQTWIIKSREKIEYVPGEPGCRLTYTEESDPNDDTGKRSTTQQSPTGVTDIVPTWREEYTYGQEACTNDVPPYMHWVSTPCNETYTDIYGYDYDTAALELFGYEETNYDEDNCLAHEKTAAMVDGYPFNKESFWYNTPDGNYPNKLSTAYDNSETRLIRAESSWWSGLSWNNSFRGLYAYEGMSSLDTEDNSLVPIGFELKQNYPNPFNPTTSISYELPQESDVSIKIYNSLGHEIRTLVNEFKPVGEYQVTWNGISNSGERVSDGTYFVQLKAGDFTQTRKMVLLK